MSPTTRTLKLLASEGFSCDVVERQITRVLKRDFLGVVDVIAVRAGETVGAQVTSAAHHADRRAKVLASPMLAIMKAANWRVEIHSWGLRKGEWTCRRESL